LVGGNRPRPSNRRTPPVARPRFSREPRPKQKRPSRGSPQKALNSNECRDF